MGLQRFSDRPERRVNLTGCRAGIGGIVTLIKIDWPSDHAMMAGYQPARIVTRGCMAMFCAASLMIQSACSPPSANESLDPRSSQFDGLYSGVSTVTFGAVPLCGSDTHISLTIDNGMIDYKFGNYPLKFRLSEDGKLTYTVWIGEWGKHSVDIMGKVSGQILEAENVVSSPWGSSPWGGPQTHWCSYHWSLKKIYPADLGRYPATAATNFPSSSNWPPAAGPGGGSRTERSTS